jgi:hypothetical protein
MSAVNRLAAEDCFAGLRCAKEEEAARKGPGPGAIAARKMRRWVRREEEKAWSSLSVPCSSSLSPCDVHCSLGPGWGSQSGARIAQP